MDGIHDLGGRQSFGPIDVHEPDEPFHAAWEARLLGIVRGMSRPVPWSLDWFRHVRELIDPADYLTRPYYDQWLQTYAAMMVESGLASVSEIASGRSDRPIARLPPPAPPQSVVEASAVAVRFDRDTGQVPVFVVGDPVRARTFGHPGHCRMPQYVRGRTGLIHAIRGVHVLPDTNLDGTGAAEPLYTVSFAAADLWPEAVGRRDRVFVDLWESYLERP
jgi:nitrile hydratase